MLPPWARAGLRAAWIGSGPVLFVAGIGWDALTLGRIDAWLDNLILGAYLLGLGAVIVWEQRALRGAFPRLLVRTYPVARMAVHFLMGGLLSAYAVYYFQSAATWISTLWLVGIALLLVVNEFVGRLVGTLPLRLALYLLAAFSFLLFWIPVATGWLARGVTVLAAVGALVATAGVLALVDWSPSKSVAVAGRAWRGVIQLGDRIGQPVPRRIDESARALWSDLITVGRRMRGLPATPEPRPVEPTDPAISRLRRDPIARMMWQVRPTLRYGSYAVTWGTILVTLLVLDLVGVIPPVPLSTLHLGIYREVEVGGGAAVLRYESPAWWRPFASDDGRFRLRQGDRACAFAPVYAPRLMAPRLYHRWEFYDAERREWVWTGDRSTWVQASGGLENGSLHYTCKRNGLRVAPWRVSVETPDGRVLGRRRFVMVQGPDDPPQLVEGTWP